MLLVVFSRAVAVNAVDKEDGTYLLQVRPEHSGMHILHVMVNSHQIQVNSHYPLCCR